MKFKLLAAVLCVSVLPISHSEATRFPVAIGPTAIEYKKDMHRQGFKCGEVVKKESITCVSRDKGFTVTANLIGGNWPSTGHIRGFSAVANRRSAQHWLVELIEQYPPREEINVNFNSWVYQSCLKREEIFLSDYLMWGTNFSITGSGKSCTLRIWSFFT